MDLPHLTAEELIIAKTKLLKVSQHHTYPDVFNELKKQGHLATKHPHSNLALFVNQQGLLRVGGRLQKSGLADYIIHSILLSTPSHIVRILVINEHVVSLH